MCKRTMFFMLLVAVVLAGCAAAFLPVKKCTNNPYAGYQDFALADASTIVPVQYPELCHQPIPVATGTDGFDVHVGVVTPSRTDFVVTGTPGTTGRLYWQVVAAP